MRRADRRRPRRSRRSGSHGSSAYEGPGYEPGSERRKPCQAHLADAIPLDLRRDAHLRVTGTLADAGIALARTELP